MKVKEESEKVGLLCKIKKTKNLASGPITSWQIDGKQWKQWETLFPWTSKLLQMVTTAMKLIHLLLGRKLVTNLDSILKSRDIILLTKVCLVKAMVFPVVMYGCEWWAIKKTEHRRIDSFELWCWRRLLRVPGTARRSNQSKVNQSWIFIGRTDAEAETPILWPPDVKNLPIRKDPDAGKDWKQEEKGTTEDEMVKWHHQRDGHESIKPVPGLVMDRKVWHAAVHGFAESQTWLSDWTELNGLP